MLPGLAPVFAGRAGVSVNYLVVAGGGGSGASFGGGGGGAGGMLTGSLPVAAGSLTYVITVGAGGGGGGTSGSGISGQNSSIASLVVATGGGGGGGGVSAAPGGNGGSGGAGAGNGSGTNGTGIPGQGNNATVSGGGGGGAGAVGAANGGAGLASSISGTSVTYAGGGAGSGGLGGVGGGGAASVNGTPNTGGGGGAWSGTGAAGAGGSGVVILSYPTGSMIAAGGNVTTSGGNTIHTFTSSGQWTITGPSVGGNDSFTKLLLHLDGANGSTTVTDSSASNHAIGNQGGWQISTVLAKFGTASASFAGSNGCLFGEVATQADFTFGTGDFTFECWVRFNVLGTQTLIDFGYTRTAPDAAPGIFMTDTNGHFGVYTLSTNVILGTVTIAVNQWYHVAVARASGTLRMFINGVQDGSSVADSNNYGTATHMPAIGISGTDFASFPLNGYLDEIRVSKGIARYTANFTPPTGPFG